jgi:hypothetical protein
VCSQQLSSDSQLDLGKPRLPLLEHLTMSEAVQAETPLEEVVTMMEEAPAPKEGECAERRCQPLHPNSSPDKPRPPGARWAPLCWWAAPWWAQIAPGVI